nr:protein SUPPRESSOR OF GENE SILENCING 3 [Ipomoea batatas]GMD56574.1 protein SUPPRESSOR OF GENE SILENCING 3 [Ipomoea batatas]
MMSSTKGGRQASGSSTYGSAQDDGWEVYGKKSKNKAGTSGVKQYAPQNSAAVSTGNAWGTSGNKPWNNGGSGRGSVRPSSGGRDNARFPPAIAPPLQHGWNWSSRVASNPSSSEDGLRKIENNQTHPATDIVTVKNEEEEDDEDEDLLDDSDEELLSDEYDSDESQKSHETAKKNSWFKEFFDSIDSLSNEELNDPERQWHCSACKGGPGAIEWFRGLQPLLTHAKTRRSKRVKLHRKLSKLLEEELRRRGTTVVQAGEMLGKWNGVKEKDFEIVWPPMVIIMNTRDDKDDNDKWTGMGNQELLDYFSEYAAVRARHSYGPQGHRGMSVLIFEASAVGYLEAELLSKHFTDNGRDREAWQRNNMIFYQGGKRQLFGYMATKKDLDVFNQHSQGKSKLKYEIRSHLEMVVNSMKQMNEDNQQLIWYKNKAQKHFKHAKAVEESFVLMGEKYRQSTEETKIVRSKTKDHHVQKEEEIEYLEHLVQERFQSILEARDHSAFDDHQRFRAEVGKYFESLDLEKVEPVERKQLLVKAHDEWVNKMKQRHRAEEAAVEEEFNAALTRLEI